MAAAVGNKYAVGRSGYRWRDAIRKALAQDKQALVKVAEALIAAAQAGEIAAIKELGDRLDGKAVAMVQADVTTRDAPGVDAPPLVGSYEEWLERHGDAKRH